ncbi:hypothetical protein PPACK8108_LOCUS16338 [Phakopsora pachyrhizi]|uniref:Uncharacterized protein n=1 Tax=Phakopsora pachyrhizi TaxID=170000 RepID=A0AAV0BBA8_PHAPC|nr:hypothetical protein PPACK8108_LOCUS16338 [Phakopsora pachyrhizi]
MGHCLALNVCQIKKDSFTRAEEPPPLKKLAILEDLEINCFEPKTSIKFYPPGCDRGKTLSPDQKLPLTLKTVIAATLASSSLAQANEVKAWEEEIKTCSHVTNLEQQHNSGPVLQGTDEKLQFHLAHFGIETANQEKTKKSMTELCSTERPERDDGLCGSAGTEQGHQRSPFGSVHIGSPNSTDKQCQY